jgi:hypothetical protein
MTFNRYYLAPFDESPLLDTSDWHDVRDSVKQLQLWTGDETGLEGKSIEQLLHLQEKLEKQLQGQDQSEEF